jgi:MinD superfamily P-loop ATPase
MKREEELVIKAASIILKNYANKEGRDLVIEIEDEESILDAIKYGEAFLKKARVKLGE